MMYKELSKGNSRKTTQKGGQQSERNTSVKEVANKQRKSHHQSLEKHKLKPHRDATAHLLECLKCKRLTVPSAGAGAGVSRHHWQKWKVTQSFRQLLSN